jgi:integrase/recombinase XerD
MSGTGWAKGLAQSKKGWGVDTKQEIAIDGMFNAFMLRCEREGLTRSSKRTYEERLPEIITFLESKGRVNWSDVTQKDAEEWIEAIQRRTVSDHYKQGWLRVTKTFLRWSASIGGADHSSVMPRMKKLQGKQYLPSPATVNAFLKAFDQSVIWGLRDYTVTMLILACGARSGEVCGMSPEDIIWDNNQVRLFGKGRKERFAPVSGDELFPVLNKWLRARTEYVRENGNGADRLFITRAGGKCNPNTFDQAFAKLRRLTGIGVKGHNVLTPHTLRHYFCTMYLVNGGDPFVLQKIAGHTEISTTLNYLHHANQIGTVRNDYAKVDPLRRLREAGNGEAPKRRKMR